MTARQVQPADITQLLLKTGSYTVNGLNEYTAAGTTSFGYAARGNLTSSFVSGVATTFNYSKSNNLISSGGVTMNYAPTGRLSSYNIPSGTSNFYYAGDQLVAERSGSSGAILRRYVPGPGLDEPIVWYERSGTTGRRTLQSDERGSIVAVSDASGNLLYANTYDEFGIPASGNIGRFGFTGQTWFPEVGLYNYKVRWYSPTLGRFMQTDPIGYGNDLNWYNYAHGDPINMKDPSGLCGSNEGPCQFADYYGNNWKYDSVGVGDSRSSEGCKNIGNGGSYSNYLSTLNWGYSDIFQPNVGTPGGMALPQSGQSQSPCDVAVNEKEKIRTAQLSASMIAAIGLTGSIGRFTNLQTGTTGYFYTVGGGAGLDAGVSGTVSRYNNAASLSGFNDNLNVSLTAVIGLAWSRHNDLSGNRVGNSFGISGGFDAGFSATMTETHLFGCTLGGK